MNPSFGVQIQFTECSVITQWVFTKEKKKFGTHFTNSDGKVVYTRYILTDHIREDCYNYVPTPLEWIKALETKERPVWMIRTLDLDID